jgi:hypothetical protein
MFKAIQSFINRFFVAILALHGFFHVIEFGTAMYEEAYITATLAFLGASSMVYGAYFLESHHHHHHHHPTTETEE